MNTENIANTLYHLGIDGKLNVQERVAVNEAYLAIMRLKHREGENFDFQGWPIEKLTMNDLRKFVRDNGALDDDVKLLVLQDDGMGYGANNGYCSDLSVSEDKDGNKSVQIWF